MPKQRIPAYRHQKSRNLAVVRINGRDHYLGPWRSKASLREYDRLIAEWLANGRTVQQDDVDDPKNTITIVELISRFVNHQRAEYPNWRHSDSVPAKFKKTLSLLRSTYGNQRATDFGPLKLKALRQKMIDQGITRKYVNESVNRVRAVFQWGVSEELVPSEVYQALAAVSGLRKDRTAAKESGHVLPVDEADIQATLLHMPEVVSDMVRLQRLLGCRPGEICQMRPRDIDKQEGVWLYRPARHKTQHHGKNRVIPIGPKAQAILTPYLLRPAGAFCFCPKDSEKKRRRQRHANRKTPMSCGNRPGTNVKRKPNKQAGESYTRDSYRRAIARACKKADVPKWSPNQLRHTAATEIRKRYGLEAAQVVLGHSNAAITQVYAERDLSLAVRVASEVG